MKIVRGGMAVATFLSSVAGAFAEPGLPQVDEGRVSGRVVRPADMRGIAAVQVTLIGPMAGQAERALASFPLMAEEIAETLHIAQLRSQTDGEGRFSFSALTTGFYAVVLRRDGYFGPASPGSPPISPFMTTTVIVGGRSSPAELIVNMMEGAAVRGTVRDTDGNPVASARVVLVGESASGRNVSTNADGTYALVAAPDAYRISALRNGPAGPLIGVTPALGQIVSTVRVAGQAITLSEGADLTVDLVVD